MAPLLLPGLLPAGIHRLPRASTTMALMEPPATHPPGLRTGPLGPRSPEYPRQRGGRQSRKGRSYSPPPHRALLHACLTQETSQREGKRLTGPTLVRNCPPELSGSRDQVHSRHNRARPKERGPRTNTGLPVLSRRLYSLSQAL